MTVNVWQLITSALLLLLVNSISFSQSHRTVALTGMPADDGVGGESTYGAFGTATLNNNGHVAFLAELVPGGAGLTAGIWSEGDGTGAKLIAVDGGAASGVVGGVFANIVGTQPFINDLGQVLFRTNLAIGSGGVSSSNNSGIWIANPGESPQLVLREGDSAPGTAAVFSEQTTVIDRNGAKFNNVGQATVHHRLAVGVPTSSDFGIWRSELGETTQLVAREGTLAADFPSGSTYYSSLVASPTINDNGTIAYYGSVTTFPGQPATDEVIWMGTPGNVSRVHESGDAAPGIPGASFLDLETPSINNAGDYVFAGFVDTNVTGIWASRMGSALELLYRGDEAPFHSLGTSAIENFGTVLINSAGEIAFNSLTFDVPGADPPLVDATTNASLWSEGGGGGLREVAREGDQPVGIESGVEYDFFSDPAINALGQTAFLANLRGNEVNTSNDQAIFVEDAAGTLHLIARKGDLLDVDDGLGVDDRTIATLFFWNGTGNEDGRRSGLNDSGQLAFSAVFTDGSAGIFVSNVVATLDLPGDFNNDGMVNAADYVTWRDHLGSATSLPNDATTGVDSSDYVVWKGNFGAPGAGSFTTSAVPEPSMVLLGLFCAVVGCAFPVFRQPKSRESCK